MIIIIIWSLEFKLKTSRKSVTYCKMKVALIIIATLMVLATSLAIPIFIQSPDQEAKDSLLFPMEVSRVKRGGFGSGHAYFGRWYDNYFCC